VSFYLNFESSRDQFLKLSIVFGTALNMLSCEECTVIKRVKGSFEHMKMLNISIILKIIRERTPISRVEIAEISGLTPASVTKITQQLIDLNIIIEVGSGESSGGRPPVYLKLNPSAFYVVGICFAPGRIDVILTNFEASIITSRKEKVAAIDPASAFMIIEKIFHEMLEEAKIRNEQILGVGVAMNGIVNSDSGVSIFAPFYQWKNVNIKSRLEEQLKVPVFVENDVNSMALAERWFGLLKNYKMNSSVDDNFVMVYIGNGVGAGIIINDKIYHGYNYAAGEIGHIVVDNNGIMCSCGKNGCLESFVSVPAIEAKVRTILANNDIYSQSSVLKNHINNINIDIICQAALDGDPLAINIIKKAGEDVGIAIANLLIVLNPSKVIIAGPIIQSGAVFFDAVRNMMEKETLEILYSSIEISGTQLGEFRSSIGGVVLVLMDYLKN
jgi:N-acetylglucosamine repressor